MSWKVPLFDLDYDKSEENAVVEVLNSKWLTQGEKTIEFETKFASFLEKDLQGVAVSSCTAALYMSLLVAEVGKGDEVIVSGLSFIAAVNSVAFSGATAILADSTSLVDWNISVEDIRNKITSRTKALIIVHFAGVPCDMDEITAICEEYNILLIEDCAHAIGSEYKGEKCGTFGDISCFSFFSNKNLSTGEGGMFVTRNEEFYKKARLLRSHGMTSLTVERHTGKNISYDVVQPGLNFRIDEIRSALGITQLDKLENNNLKRKIIAHEYYKLFKGSGVIIPFHPLENTKTSCYHIFPVLVPSDVERKFIIEKLKNNGIQTSIHYPAVNSFNYYSKKIKYNLPVADKISEKVITLPIFPGMSTEQTLIVVKEFLNTIHE
ncbi:MAG: DegT/DnrJ/EryC1/StrS family aminotransferase [Bacteroidetes bacterium]|nr:DegT/DnrJ/EryC1/StrS family aminotransferase [Bacteroidota bacterium]